MAYPAARFLRIFGVAVLSALAAIAQEPVPNPPKPVAESAPLPERSVSAHVAGLLAAATPRYAVAKPEEQTANSPSPMIVGKPANEIVHLPNFVVREQRVPTAEDVRTPRGLEVYAMNKYLGSPTGFSRGVLNRFTIADAWNKSVKHVPILNWFEWFSSPEKSALDMYYDDEVRKKLRDLYELQAIPSTPSIRSVDKTVSPPPTASPATGGT